MNLTTSLFALMHFLDVRQIYVIDVKNELNSRRSPFWENVTTLAPKMKMMKFFEFLKHQNFKTAFWELIKFG